MFFKSFNFKLVVINELLDMGFFQAEIEAIKEKYWSEDDWSYTPIPEIVNFFQNLELSEDLLAKVVSITFDGGNEIYFHLMPNWDGEETVFDVDSIEDLNLLPNLENYIEISMVEVEDRRALLGVKNLKRAFFEKKEEALRKKLLEKGVSLD